MGKQNSFSLSARFKSFVYAFSGLFNFIRTEHNTWLHLVATAAVVILAIVFPVSQTEIMALVFATGLVWMAEIINSAIERIMDFVSPQKHPSVKLIKDMAAGAALVAAITALAVGCLVFIPKL